MLFRYLALRELGIHGRVPLLIELRDLKKYYQLEQAVYGCLTRFGLKASSDDFHALATTREITLLLDAFDELDPTLASSVTRLVSQLVARYQSLTVLISSRPGTSLFSMRESRCVDLLPLEQRSRSLVLQKFEPNEKRVVGLLEKISRRPEIEQVLDTPLMVALLALQYREKWDVPSSTADFYSRLFELLLWRHDRAKEGAYQRHRLSGLGDRELARVFDAYSYVTRIGRPDSSHEDVCRAMAEALKRIGKPDADPSLVARDIADGTCLLLDDSSTYVFAHRTVAEFHASRFIASDDSTAQRFYAAMMKERRWESWRKELEFLEVIDPARFIRYFYLPMLRQFVAHQTVPFDWNQSELARIYLRVTDSEVLGLQFHLEADRPSFFFERHWHSWVQAHASSVTRYLRNALADTKSNPHPFAHVNFAAMASELSGLSELIAREVKHEIKRAMVQLEIREHGVLEEDFD